MKSQPAKVIVVQGVNPGREAARLISASRWFALATIDQTGTPTLSYIPFAFVDDAFGMVSSRLAAHTANLLARRHASILLVDDGSEPHDAYARSRLSISVSACPRPPASAQADAIWLGLEVRQGATVRTLRMLPDFEAIALEPIGGRLVLGFASAHDLDGTAIVDALRAMTNPG